MTNDTTPDTASPTAHEEIHKMFLEVDAAFHRLLRYTEVPDFDPSRAIRLWDEVEQLQERLKMPLVSRFTTMLPDAALVAPDQAA